jgi:hypothetical protein
VLVVKIELEIAHATTLKGRGTFAVSDCNLPD